jgi:hypothetical protein
MCSHGRQKHSCRVCNKNRRQLKKCPHNKRRTRCKECNGGSICVHGKRRESCINCMTLHRFGCVPRNECRKLFSQLWSVAIGGERLSEIWTVTIGAAELCTSTALR